MVRGKHRQSLERAGYSFARRLETAALLSPLALGLAGSVVIEKDTQKVHAPCVQACGSIALNAVRLELPPRHPIQVPPTVKEPAMKLPARHVAPTVLKPTRTPAAMPTTTPAQEFHTRLTRPKANVRFAGRGFDISWPQCGVDQTTHHHTKPFISSDARLRLPKKADFAIVGLNYGKPNTVNPCLVDELKVAQEIAGDNVSVYVNTANYAKQSKQAERDGKKAATFALRLIQSAVPYLKQRMQPFIWEDVERGNTWQANTVAGHASNLAMLTAVVGTFKAAGYETGSYTAKDEYAHPIKLDMWHPIMGTVPSTSIINGPEWIAAPGSDGCRKAPFIEHGYVVLGQNVVNDIDNNHSC